MQSIGNKVDNDHCFLNTNEVDLLIFTENLLTGNETEMFKINGYEAIHSCEDSKGGEALIYITNDLSYETCEIVNIDSPYNTVAIQIIEADLKVCARYECVRTG